MPGAKQDDAMDSGTTLDVVRVRMSVVPRGGWRPHVSMKGMARDERSVRGGRRDEERAERLRARARATRKRLAARHL